MTMKQFLLDKLNSLTEEVLIEFNKSLTNNLPTTNPLAQAIWGDNENGFWYLDQASAWFFEDYGIYHVIDTERNFQFCEFTKKFNQNSEITTIPINLEFEELVLDNDCHPFNLSKGTPLYYNKFVNPRKNYGNPIVLDTMLGNIIGENNEMTEQFFEWLTQYSLFYDKYREEIEILNSSSGYLNRGDNDVFRDKDGYFLFRWGLGGIPDSTLSPAYINPKSIKFNQSTIERIIYIWTKSKT